MQPFLIKMIPRLCVLALALSSAGPLGAAELPVELRYPMQTDSVILTGLEGSSLVFRPKGADFGGRAYLDFSTLEKERVMLNFLLSDKFYEGLKKLKNGQPLQALPLIEPEARPMLNYIELSHLPGNYVSTVQAYFEALRGTGNWKRLTTLIAALPMREVPPPLLDEIGQTTLSLHRAQAATDLEKIHRTLLAMDSAGPAQLEVLLSLGDSWREVGEYQKAFDLYHKVSMEKSAHQVVANLWAAYCGFYLEDSKSLQSILQDLPKIQINEAYFSLRELIDARWKLRQAEYPPAMLAAARGKTYAAVTDPWYPELLHTLALLYEKMEMPDAATLAHQEVSIMFPASQWASKSLEIIHHQNNKTP